MLFFLQLQWTQSPPAVFDIDGDGKSEVRSEAREKNEECAERERERKR